MHRLWNEFLTCHWVNITQLNKDKNEDGTIQYLCCRFHWDWHLCNRIVPLESSSLSLMSQERHISWMVHALIIGIYFLSNVENSFPLILNSLTQSAFNFVHVRKILWLMSTKLIGPWEILMWFLKCNLQSCFTDWYLQIFLWQCPQMNVTEPYWR